MGNGRAVRVAWAKSFKFLIKSPKKIKGEVMENEKILLTFSLYLIK